MTSVEIKEIYAFINNNKTNHLDNLKIYFLDKLNGVIIFKTFLIW